MQQLEKIAENAGVPQKYAYWGVIGLCMSFIIFGVGSSILTNVVGVLYPAYMSFKALESPGADDDTMWLTYWVVFSFLSIGDSFAGIILRFIPFYYVLKVGFLIWMYSPSTQGALTVFNNFLRPWLDKYENQIDAYQQQAEDAMKKGAEMAKEEASVLKEKVTEATSK